MPKIDFKYKIVEGSEKGFVYYSLSKKQFESFNASKLGLGDISQQGKYVQALAAFYDLEGFTSFSNQVDSYLVVPEFLQRFIDWLFRSLAEEFKQGEVNSNITIWGSLPFYAKFLGDGLLFLWDTAFNEEVGWDLISISNIVLNLNIISERYRTEFLPEIQRHVSKPPNNLRCGIARGQIISIGEGNDYVGSCINIASRLQKLSQLTFALSRRGFDLSQLDKRHKFWNGLILKKVELRGVGDEELVYIKKKEFRRLPRSERQLFKRP
ncbi:MAG: hypothetical protein AUG51_18165 [Acidobacteria bacterium 13_1_20CM_3_53_8]|nr:MAG: hypothetical protein AUG51_18165 [Acidobacteria bacterium 13_1_20CM_3_53_8]